MNRQMNRISPAREWTKSFGIPAVVMALWVAAVMTLAVQVESPIPLQDAIEEVLAVPPADIDPAPAQALAAARAASHATPAPKPSQS